MSKKEEKKRMVTLPEEDKKEEESQDQYTEAELKEQGYKKSEIETAKEAGFVKEGKDQKEEKEGEKTKKEEEEDSPKKQEEENEQEEEEKQKEKKEKEEGDKEEELSKEEVEKLSPKERGLYYEMRNEREKRQSALKEKELLTIKLKSLEEKVDTLGKSKEDTDQDEITKKLQEKQAEVDKILEGDKDEFGDNTVSREVMKKYHNLQGEITELKQQKSQQEKQDTSDKQVQMQDRLNKLETVAKNNPKEYPDYEKTIKMAQEVMKKDPTDLYAKEFVLSASDASTGKKPLEIIYRLANLHPGYKKGSEDEKTKEEKEKANRMAKNAKKQKSSASLGASGPRKVAEEDLTIEDVAKMPQSQYDNLSPKTRQRLLGS